MPMTHAPTNYASRSDRLLAQILDWLVAVAPMFLAFFAAGTTDWTNGLRADDPAISRITHNLLARLSAAD